MNAYCERCGCENTSRNRLSIWKDLGNGDLYPLCKPCIKIKKEG
jgi:hypothetical protein